MGAAERPPPDDGEVGEAGDVREDAAARERIEKLRAKYPTGEDAAWKATVGDRLERAMRGAYSESRDPMAGRGEPPAEPTILVLLDEMIALQREKVLAVARRIVPTATFDDTLQPHDTPKIHGNPLFQYEDGLLAGLLAAQAAIRARLREAGDRGGAP